MIRNTLTTTDPLAVSVDEAARRLAIGRTLLYDLIGQGKIRAIKLNSRTIVPVSEIDRILTSNEAA